MTFLSKDHEQKNRPEKSGFFEEFRQDYIPKNSRKKSKQVVKYFWSVARDEFKNFMQIMQTCKGRDKIFGLAQYMIDLYIKCRKYAYQTSPFITAIRDP